ncbi:MAG: MBL fold metallo-hydrolase [Candidatus Izimaplasma sp.]|nr:MBL fold metallo-hydrolase [Candidatus Izimaplasma bacterium]
MIKRLTNNYTENTYIVAEGKHCYIIDPGAELEEITSILETKELTLKAVLLTHGHFDHILTLNDVLEVYDVPVYLHEDERDFLFDPNLNLSSTIYNKITVQKKNRIKTFKEGDTFNLKRNTLKVLHTPGHTRGSVGFRFNRYYFSGDTLFKNTVGRTDLPTSNKGDLEKSLKKITSKLSNNTLVYPGHGTHTTVLTEKQDNVFIKQ